MLLMLFSRFVRREQLRGIENSLCIDFYVLSWLDLGQERLDVLVVVHFAWRERPAADGTLCVGVVVLLVRLVEVLVRAEVEARRVLAAQADAGVIQRLDGACVVAEYPELGLALHADADEEALHKTPVDNHLAETEDGVGAR